LCQRTTFNVRLPIRLDCSCRKTNDLPVFETP
jgi:hypothetical protein